jgi:hypothetical protein
MNTIETFDQHKLNYILEHSKDFKDVIIKTETAVHVSPARKEFLENMGQTNDGEVDYFMMPRKYLNLSINGVNKVNYRFATDSNGKGRQFAVGGVSLQCMPVLIRNTIAGEFYDDIDMVNAHPTILLHLCNKHEIDCDYLQEYVDNRDEKLQELMEDNDISRDDAKQVFLALMNGGDSLFEKLEVKSKFLKSYRNEMKNILQSIAEQYPEVHKIREKTKPHNALGSTMNTIVCQLENNILMFIYNFIADKAKINKTEPNVVLCFDGIMIEKGLATPYISKLEKAIFKEFGIKIMLKVKEMTDVLELPTNIPEYAEVKAFDRHDPFVWNTFQGIYHGTVYDSVDSMINNVVVDFRRVFALISNGSSSYIIKTDCDKHLFDFTSAKKIGSHFRMFVGKRSIYLKDLIVEILTKLPVYSQIVFDPLRLDNKTFNLWPGLKAENANIQGPKSLKKLEEAIKPILEHIRIVYCNRNEEHYNYFLKLLYVMLKYTNLPLGVIVFLFSRKHGSGKNIILDFLQEHVFGRNLTHESAGLSGIVGNFNARLENKKMVVINEMVSVAGEWRSDFETIKTMATSPTINIEKKGIDSVEMVNRLCIWMLSNSPDSIILQESDRRHFCLSVNEEFVGNEEYFNNLLSYLNETNGVLFYRYIIKWGDQQELDCNAHRKIPMTAFKQEIIEKNEPSPLKFAKSLKEIVNDSNDYTEELKEALKKLKDFDKKDENKVPQHMIDDLELIENKETKEYKALKTQIAEIEKEINKRRKPLRIPIKLINDRKSRKDLYIKCLHEFEEMDGFYLKTLFETYNDWCNETNEPKKSISKFKSDIKRVMDVEHKRFGNIWAFVD